MTKAFFWERRVEFCETDAAGIVHFSSLIIYMEQAEHALLRSLGLSVAPTLTSGSRLAKLHDPVSWPRVRVTCDFLAPARFEDVIELQLSIDSIGSKSITYQHQLRVGEKIIAKGSITAVCCRLENGSLVGTEIPLCFRTPLSQFQAAFIE